LQLRNICPAIRVAKFGIGRTCGAYARWHVSTAKVAVIKTMYIGGNV
jgi:hypothetical protein